MSYLDHPWFSVSRETPTPLACEMMCQVQRNIASTKMTGRRGRSRQSYRRPGEPGSPG